MNGGHPLGGSPIGSQVSRWKFDENYGDMAYDTVGTNNGNLAGSGTTCPQSGDSACPTWTTAGRFTDALDFENSGTTKDYVEVTDASSLDIAGSFSIGLWVNPESLPSTNRVAYLVSKTGDPDLDTSGTQANYGIGLNNNIGISGQGLTCGFENTSHTDYSTNFAYTLPTATWSHLMCVFDDAVNVMRFYVNGQQVNSASITGTPATNNKNLFIGREIPSEPFSAGEAFDGQLDDIQLFAGALSEEEVRVTMNANAAINFGTGYKEADDLTGGAGTEPVGYWNFDENTGTSTVHDKSGHDYSGSMVGSMTETDWVPGKSGSALEFDGSNDYVNVTSTAFQIPSQTGTVSAWVYPKVGGTYDILSSGVTMNDFRLSPGNNLYGFYISSEYRVSYATDPTVGQWTFVTLTWDQTNGSILYYNGIRVASNSTPPPAYSQTGMKIGSNTSGTENMNGMIDEVKVYNYVRTPAQISYDYNQGAPLGWWKFDDCSGSQATDSSRRNNHGSIVITGSGTNQSLGTCGSGTGTEAWNNGTTGKHNASIYLDGEMSMCKLLTRMR